MFGQFALEPRRPRRSDQRARTEQAQFGMLPSHQSFSLADLAVAHVNNRLVDHAQLSSFNGIEQTSH